MAKASKTSLRFFHSKQRRAIKAWLLAKYGPYCQLCLVWGRDLKTAEIDLNSSREDKSLSIDHIIPTGNGGLNHKDNMWVTHAACNNARGDKDLNQIVFVDFSSPKPKIIKPRVAYTSSSNNY